jgi:hypothetical protein
MATAKSFAGCCKYVRKKEKEKEGKRTHLLLSVRLVVGELLRHLVMSARREKSPLHLRGRLRYLFLIPLPDLPFVRICDSSKEIGCAFSLFALETQFLEVLLGGGSGTEVDTHSLVQDHHLVKQRVHVLGCLVEGRDGGLVYSVAHNAQ